MKYKKIALIVDSDVAPRLYQNSLDEYNNRGETFFYSIAQHVKSRNEVVATNFTHDTILFIDFELEDGSGLEWVQDLLNENPQLHVLIFCEPKDLNQTKIIAQWSEDYPLAVIGRVIKPIQPSGIWEFLKITEKAMPRFDMTGFDWDEEWGDWNGMD